MPRKVLRGSELITKDLEVGGNLSVTGTLTPALGTDFADTVTFHDPDTATKKARLDCVSVTAGQTRVLTVPDADLTIVGTATAQTLTNKTLTTPKVAIIHDANGNEALELTAVAGAVNQPELVNSATTKAVEFKTKGGDADIPLKITAKGYAPIMLYGVVAEYVDPTVVNDASDQAIAVAALVKKEYQRDCNGANRQDTLPSAAALVAAFPGAYNGLSFIWTCVNTSNAAETLTLAAPDAAVTIEGTATVAQNNTKLFRIRLTNVASGTEAYTARSIGTLTH
ncbi:MAG: hypothetical protein LLG20_03935 [Acidobacteriales bacterium]|nr:hypothetical protein [Terriglobales bacterium]